MEISRQKQSQGNGDEKLNGAFNGAFNGASNVRAKPSEYDVGIAAQAACLLEVAAPKPGNVNRYSDFADLFLEDFLLSAVAIGRHMGKARAKTVGENVLEAVVSTQGIVGTNTNLGILLLFAPLAKAYSNSKRGNLRDNLRDSLRDKLKEVLASLTIADSIDVYRAINIASAGGMGRVDEADISTLPAITLRESMFLAKERDSVAREYVTDYEITFGLGLPVLQSLLAEGQDLPTATVQLYLTLLAQIPDSLIARKNDLDAAMEVSNLAAAILREGGMFSVRGRSMINDFDHYLRQQGNKLNPGTTADLTATALFVYFLENGLQKWREVRPESGWPGIANDDHRTHPSFLA